MNRRHTNVPVRRCEYKIEARIKGIAEDLEKLRRKLKKKK